MNKVELILTNHLGQSVVVDVDELPYRLNRVVFATSTERMRILGGTYSSDMLLNRSKTNNQFFTSKGEMKSSNKFYSLNNYHAVMYENGVEVIRGNFRITEVGSQGYSGEFYDEDISWVDRLSNIKLNELGYVDGKPTWLQPFDGASSFNDVNNKSNDETNYICPTLIYNNSPVTDYFDFTDADIWGVFREPISNPPVRITNGRDFPDSFKAVTGLFSSRLGMTFEDFPPAMYYRNVLEKCFEEIGMTISSALFEEPWFNALYMTYSGDEFLYNWKNIASIYAYSDYHSVVSEENMDKIIYIGRDITTVNRLSLTLLGPGMGTRNWIRTDEEFRFNKTSVIKHDNPNTPGTVDKIVAYNKFNVDGQYICPVDGQYTINVKSTYTNILDDAITVESSPMNPIFIGFDLISAFGTWDADSKNTILPALRRYAWDDNVLVIRRYNEGGGEAYGHTDEYLYKYMNGETKQLTVNPSDVIAYFSPKRAALGGVPAEEIVGSPLTDFTSNVTIHGSSHNMISNNMGIRESESMAHISVTLDMKKNERIEIYWTSITNINATLSLDATIPQRKFDAYDWQKNAIKLGDFNNEYFEITYDCGEYDLDLAYNLPQITAKDFISNFITQFDLMFTVKGNVVEFQHTDSYLSNEVYDITSRVVDNNWSSAPLIGNPKNLNIGYDNDNEDRLLNGYVSECIADELLDYNYANVVIENDNIYSTGTIKSFNGFSSTKFYEGKYEASQFATASVFLPKSIDPESGLSIDKGIAISLAAPKEFPYHFPSLQSNSSFAEVKVGQLNYNFNSKVRLLYHLGTLNNYIGYSDDFQCLIDSPRADANFIKKPKHWYMPTASAFDKENNNPYPTLRYDTENGLYNRYFDNMIDVYNKSEVLTLKMSIRNIDWVNMRGSKLIRYQDSLYRLMEINDYDPLTSALCTVKLLKEI